MTSNHPINPKSLISLPVGTKILLKTSVPTSIFEVLRQDKVEVKAINLETNAEEFFKKEKLFDLHYDGLATFIYPNQSWEGSVDQMKRSAAEIMRGLTEAQQQAIQLKHELCKKLAAGANKNGHVPRCYVAEISKEARAAHPMVKGLSRSSLYGFYRSWIRGGGHIATLFPSARRGNWMSRFPKEVTELFHSFMNDHYLQRNAPEAQEVYDAFNKKILSINERRSDDFQLKIPTLDTFCRWIRKLDRFEVALKRHGEAVARKCAGYSANLEKPTRPLEVVEVDHTPIDLQLLSEITGIPCGRAWLTILVDVNSRMIVGFDISFDPPSYLSVARALEHAIKVKPEYAHTKHDWPCHGKIERLRVDNGPEFHSNDFEANCALLHITIEYTPRRKPWRKPHVERLFREINRVFHNMPASTFSNYIKKGDFNPDRNAYASIEDVTNALIRWIVDVYHQRPHGGINEIPYYKYLKGIEDYPVNLPSSINDLAIILGKADLRILHEYGIEFRGVYFKGDAVQSIRSHPDFRPGQKVEIRYLESDCTKINVLHPDGRYVELHNEFVGGDGSDEGYAGLNFYQMRLVRLHCMEELNRKADWAGISAAREDIRKTLGFYDRKRKRRYSRKDTRLAQGMGKSSGNRSAGRPIEAPTLPKATRSDPLAHRAKSAAWGSRHKNTKKAG